MSHHAEIQLGTNPLDEDSDYDGLDDGAEVNTHHTNPLKSDTDGDFIPDGDELALGLNPNSAATNGIPDNHRTNEQTVGKNSESLQYINSISDTKFSLQITAAGLAENSLSSGESGYAAVMNNPAIIGAIPEFSYTEGLTVSEVTIAAEIGASNLANTVGTYAELNPEFEGIKRLNFFRYFEEINTLLPVETTFDISGNMMYTKTDELGTYCIMDMEIWLDSLGGAELLEAAQAENEPETEPEQQTMRAFSADNLRVAGKVDVQTLGDTMAVSPVLPGESEAAESLENDDYDVIFLTDGTDSNPEYIDLASKYIKTDGGNVAKVSVTTFNRPGNVMHGKFDMSAEILKVLDSKNFDKSRNTHIILMVSEKNIASLEPTALKLLNKLGEFSDKKPHISIVSDLTEYDFDMYLAKIVSYSEGFEINTKPLKSDKAAVARAIINELGIHITQIKYLSSVNLVPLPKNFDSIYIQDVYNTGIGKNSPDYDKDGLLDYFEIAFNSGLIDFSLSEPFPTLEQCEKYVRDTQKLVYVEENMTRFMNKNENLDLTELFNSTYILPINSAPTLPDGDSDGYTDYDEIMKHDSNPLVCDVVEYGLKNDYIKVTDHDDNNSDFGGNQMWFYDANDLISIQLTGGGCGVIACADSLLYLQSYHKDIDTRYYVNSGVISWHDYEIFVRNFSLNYLKPFDIFAITDVLLNNQIPFSIPGFEDFITDYNRYIDIGSDWVAKSISSDYYTWGSNLISATNGLNDYFSDNSNNYRAFYTFLHTPELLGPHCENTIVNSLKNDIPIILLYGKEMPAELTFKYIGEQYIDKSYKMRGAHFMTITGIRINNITNKKILILSSWSNMVEIDLDEYLNHTGGPLMDGGIISIRKK